MTGTLINVLTVAVGSSIGLLLKSKLPEKYSIIVFQALGLFTLFLGVKMCFSSSELLILVFSIILGSLLGEFLKLESRLYSISEKIKSKTKSSNTKFSEGLITAFLLFCIGPMAIVGSIDEGLGKEPELLIVKSLMDGFSSIALAAVFGVGVLISIVPLLFFQGSITLFAEQLSSVLSEPMINEISACGGILLMGIGISILEIKKIKVVNMLPALMFPPFLLLFFDWIKSLF